MAELFEPITAIHRYLVGYHTGGVERLLFPLAQSMNSQ